MKLKNSLKKIIDYKQDELADKKRKIPLKDVQLKVADSEPARSFLNVFKKDEINIIAEIKKASPSKGIIREDFNPIDIGLICQNNGAKALSILTDEHFFKGSLKNLIEVKKKVSLPCLRKDFTLDEYHIFEARGAGADAVLLIAAILDEHQLKDYQALVQGLGMSALVEVHDEEELKRVLSVNPELIGINNRDLNTFKTTLSTSFDLAKKIPQELSMISESGLNTHEDLVKLKEAGYNGFLIGEALMREKNVGKKLREILSTHGIK